MSNRIFDESFMKKLEAVTLRFSSSVNSAYSGGRRSKNNGTTVEFSGFREYNQGDDFRRIDWNAYARFEKFFIRLFLDEKQLNVRIMTDISASMGFGTPSKLFASLRLSAALAYISFKIRDNVELVGLRDGERIPLGEGINTSAAFYRTLEALESVEAQGETRLEDSVKNCRGIHGGDGACIIVSDLMSGNDYQKAIDYLLYLRQQVVLVHVLSPEELEPELEGQLRLEDSESGDYCEINATKEALDYYKNALNEYKSEIRAYCMKRGVTLLELRSDEDIEEVLLNRGYLAGIVN